MRIIEKLYLLDEEYEKSLRNNTTKPKNQEVAAGVIAKVNEFENSTDTKTKSGTTANLINSFFDELKKLENKGYSEHDIVEEIWKYLDPEDYNDKIDDFFTDHVDTYSELYDLINKDKDGFANSFTDKNNPIYNLFSDEVIDNMIRNADAYFQECQRIIDDREALFQDYKDQLNWNAQAAKDQYSDEDTFLFYGRLNNIGKPRVEYKCGNNSIFVTPIYDINEDFNNALRKLILIEPKYQSEPSLNNPLPNVDICKKYIELKNKDILDGKDIRSTCVKYATEVALRNNYIIDNHLININNGRTIFTHVGDRNIHLSIDKIHGNLEVYNAFGEHQDEYSYDNKPQHKKDKSGKHDINV